MELERRQFGQTDRTWSDVEFNKMLVPDDVPTDWAIIRPQRFIIAHRPEVQGKGSGRPMTFHGLRHTYAAET